MRRQEQRLLKRLQKRDRGWVPRLSSEYHVNGRGTTMRPQTQRLGLRLGIVAGTNSRAMSIDMALSTCCDDRRNAY